MHAFTRFLLALAASTAVAAPPAEVASVAFDDGTTLGWSAASGADAHNVYRGTSPSLHDQSCRVFRAPGTQATLAEDPAPGTLFYYLVSGVNADGEGPLGAPNAQPCLDGDADLVADNLDNCPGTANASQADQDGNGVGDRCDPNTYDFESDAVGARPAQVTHVGPANQTFTVKDLAGDRSVSFNLAGVGAFERFDRLSSGIPFQDLTVYLDFEETAEVGSIELWSDGAHGWNAGGGIILQLYSAGDLRYYDRLGQNVPLIQGPAIPAGGRLRLRLVKGPGTTSTLFVDRLGGAGWENLTSFPVADDRLYRGLDVTLGDYFGGPRAFKRVTVVREVPSAPLTLRKHVSGATDWKVFQRDALDRADVPVRFYYRASEAVRVEARVVVSKTGTVLTGFDWADHAATLAAAPSGAAGELTVSDVPAGGNYDVEVRLVRVSDAAVLATGSIDEIGVGEVFLAGGQSNMSGYSGSLVGAETPIDEVHLFGNDYVWKRAVEPMDDGVDQVDLVSFESPAATILLRFAKEIHQTLGMPVAIIPGPLGGTNLFSQWQRDAADPDNRGTLYGSLLHRGLVQELGTPPRGYLWYQGESDVGRTDYETNLKQLIAQIRQDLNAPDLWFGIVQLATNQLTSDLEAWVDLQEQQKRVAETTANTVITAAVDQPRADTIHLNVEGYKVVGARLASELREHLYGEPIDASASLVSAQIVGNRRRIELTFDRAVTGGGASLFRVRQGSIPVSVSSLSVSGSVVTLQLGGQVDPGATVSYGYSTNPASPWLRDTAGTAVLAFRNFPAN
ncbi:MAG TPA: sialate O-acetylesterase [Candidatus Polarisedimenticolaceae bacterium]